MSKKSFPEQMIEQHGSLEKAISWFLQNLTREPVAFRLNLQVLLNILGREEESFRMSDELMTIAPDDPRVLFNRGWHLIHRGQFLEGFQLLEWGRSFGSYGDRQPASRQPPFSLSGPKHRHNLLVLEGGFGDQIIHARFAKNMAAHLGHGVTLACAPELMGLMSRLEGVHSVISRSAVGDHYHDSWLPGMSAPQFLLKNFSELEGQPYLSPHPEALKSWAPLIRNLSQGKQLKVGIRWAGSPDFEHQQMRRFSPSLLTDLRKNEDIKLFSFQRDNDLEVLPDEVVDLGPFLKTWEDTAAALSCMDLVISSCTSVAHLSAALGKTTWVLVPVLPYFVWALPGNFSPWYQSVKLYRQSCFGDWSDVGEKLRADLKQLLNLDSVHSRPADRDLEPTARDLNG